jgi:UDP-GlcNAc3NAcA epimerase
MNNIKILTVVGARPQFIKAAAFSHKVKEDKGLEEVIVHTGQHYDSNMSEVFFDQLQIPRPKYTLNCGGMSHGAMTGTAITEIERIILLEKPNFLLVYGDTNATLAGALAASKLHIPVVHVEAGLRSFDFRMPEEINRTLTDAVSSILCTPSETGFKNLKNEGFPRYGQQVLVNTGDIQFDSTLLFSELNIPVEPQVCSLIDIKDTDPYLVITMHRPSNVDNESKMKNYAKLLKVIGEKYKIVFPMHPRTRSNLKNFNLDFSFTQQIEPLGYTDMLKLIRHSKGVLTDSGGLQKEAHYLSKKTVVFRENTEWIELLENGSSILANEMTSPDEIISHIESMTDSNIYNPYGDGNSTGKIISAIKEFTLES